MPSEPWCSAQGILWVTPGLNPLPLPLHGGQGGCYLPSLLSHLFCKKAEKPLIKRAFYLRSDMDRELEIRDHVNGTCKEMKLSIYHLSGLSRIKQQLFKP